MLHVGSHISSAKGYLAMGKDAAKIGANTLQFFLRNPRGGQSKALNPQDIAAYIDFAKENNIGQIVAHASYVLNPASDKENLRTFARDTIADDLSRLDHTPGNFYNIHPGSRRDQSLDAGVANAAAMLDSVMTPKMQSTILLETMSGSGSEIGGKFEELKLVLDACKHGRDLGVCLDTCHVYVAGYDVARDLGGVLREFDRVIGLERLKAIHLNDSMFGLASKKDRHAKLGEGDIGLDAIAAIINHPELRDLPFLLETPNDLDGYAKEIALLKDMYQEKKPAKAAGKSPAAKAAKKPPAKPAPKKPRKKTPE